MNLVARPLRSLGQPVAATPTTPTLTVTDNGDGDAVTATVDGDSGVTNTLKYRAIANAAWTEGNSRTGDGDIAQTGLDDNTRYIFSVRSSIAGAYSDWSSVVELRITSGAATYEFVGTLEIPDESDVADGVGYGDAGTEFTGTATLSICGNIDVDVRGNIDVEIG